MALLAGTFHVCRRRHQIRAYFYVVFSHAFLDEFNNSDLNASLLFLQKHMYVYPYGQHRRCSPVSHVSYFAFLSQDKRRIVQATAILGCNQIHGL
jgi:hypothetical protein